MARLEDDPSHPRALLRPCLLLLLAERPGHGYDLVERLKPFGFDWGGPGPLYQTLRRLEETGLVVSNWDASAAGPARRTYELTDEGWEALASFADGLDRLSTRIAEYQARYRRVTRLGPPPNPDRGPEPAPARGSRQGRQASGTSPQGGVNSGRRVIAFGRKGRRRS
ncbi:MAG TPA: helix-turn-helix transcriptional regulator [Acidimicrobiales bacterium]|nr:helix-turn-helix transcriptional regulator [Acidimicrobiales bacterium]